MKLNELQSRREKGRAAAVGETGTAVYLPTPGIKERTVGSAGSSAGVGGWGMGGGGMGAGGWIFAFTEP